MVTDATKQADEATKMFIFAAERAEMALKLEYSRERHRSVARVLRQVEEEMNLSLQELKAVVGATTAATSDLSFGTGRQDSKRTVALRRSPDKIVHCGDDRYGDGELEFQFEEEKSALGARVVVDWKKICVRRGDSY